MFKLNLVTPDKRIVTDQELDEITLPAYAGELNILPGHAPLMTTLEAGTLRYRLKGQPVHELAVSQGYCQVSAEGVTVLAEHAVGAGEVDTKVVQDHLRQNETRLASETLNDADYEKVQHEIARLKAELTLVSQKTTH
jgi:F-type H+-transporting ATPase subunit epsilon